MSINVHVSGNPVSINRGKMVTADLDYSKAEFEKRRLMRLEQVRQQSKNIAEDVRNKVKREKLMQMKQIEEEGKHKLKNWQNRKLLELQTQYKEALKELGTGHRGAHELVDEDVIDVEKKKFDKEMSVKRGHRATCKLQCQNKKDHRKHQGIHDRKKLVREIEDVRAAMVSCSSHQKYRNGPKTKKKRHEDVIEDLKLDLPDSDSQESVYSLSDINEDEEISSSCSCSLKESESSNMEDSDKKSRGAYSSYVVPVNTPAQDNSAIRILPPSSQLKSSTNLDIHSAAIPQSVPSASPLPQARKQFGPTSATDKGVMSPAAAQFEPLTNIQFGPPALSVNTQLGRSVNTVTAPQSNIQVYPPHNPQGLHRDISIDTRISDRIKRRELTSHPEIRPTEVTEISEIPDSCTVRDHIHRRICCNECNCSCSNKKLIQSGSIGRRGHKEDELQNKYKKSGYNGIDVLPKMYENGTSKKQPEGNREYAGSKTNDETTHDDYNQLRRSNTTDSQQLKTVQNRGDRTNGLLVNGYSGFETNDILERDNVRIENKTDQVEKSGVLYEGEDMGRTVQTRYSTVEESGTIKNSNGKSKIRSDETEDSLNNRGAHSKLEQLKRNQNKVVEIPVKPHIKLKSSSYDRKETTVKKSHKGVKQKKPIKTIPPKKLNEKTLLEPEVSNFSKQQALIDDIDKLTKLDGRQQHPVQVYDHPNRFGYEKNMPSSSYVEKIPLESVEIIPDPDTEQNWQDIQKQRQKDAQLRGRQALEKVKLQKEYEEMQKRLPLLQKRERINEIYNDKPEYHMTEERLKEKERIKQNNLENAYNKLFPSLQPAVVTLPTTNRDEEKTPYPDSTNTFDAAEWDADYNTPQMFTAQEVKDILRAFTQQDPRERRTKLKDLLKTLKMRKEELLAEIAALPKDDSVTEIINDLRTFEDDSDEKCNAKHRRKATRKRSRRHNEGSVSANNYIDSSTVPSAASENKEVTEKSPRKKAKIRTKIIVLQNTSTQTTPKISIGDGVAPTEHEVEQKDSNLLPCSKLHVPCDCDKENKNISDSTCHIFIKLNEGDKPEVVVKSKEDALIPPKENNVDVGVQMSPSIQRHKKQKSVSTETKSDSVLEKSKTWKEQFSKNSLSTVSTSYLSPPDFQRYQSTNYFKKPQQKELATTYQEISGEGVDDQKIVPYVEKLLSMTKVSVENLSISTSTGETPSQSIIEMDSNNPKDRFQGMIHTLKNHVDNVVDGLTYSPDYSLMPLNSINSETNSQLSEKDGTSKNAVPVKQTSGNEIKSTDTIAAQFSEITDTCSKRIEALTVIIQQLRAEKIRMLQTPANVLKNTVVSDKNGKDGSTTYMELPEYKGGSKQSSSSSTSSLDEDDIFRKLMEIDYEFIDKIQDLHHSAKEKSMSSTNLLSTPSPPQENVNRQSLNNTNEEILERVRKLHNTNEVRSSSLQSKSEEFVSFLADIPRLPKFEPQENNGSQPNKRPPPSKGLTSIKKLNGNVTLVPHELSTIAEADSQLSTRLPSPETSRDSVNFHQQLLSIPEVQEVNLSSSASTPSMALNPNKSSSKESDSKLSSSRSPRIDSSRSLKEISSLAPDSTSKNKDCKSSNDYCDDSTCPEKEKTLLSSSSDDIADIENMLRSIGMAWAIPTLHKTHEALGLTSSSSSLDLSKKRAKDIISVSGSEISLRDYLSKKILKIASSTMLTDGSSSSFLGEISEVSCIQKTINSSQDKSKQLTSTPLDSSKFLSSSKSNVVFSNSDLSSIRQESKKPKRNKT